MVYQSVRLEENYRHLGQEDLPLAIDLYLTLTIMRQRNIALSQVARTLGRPRSWVRRVLRADPTLPRTALVEGLLEVDAGVTAAYELTLQGGQRHGR